MVDFNTALKASKRPLIIRSVDVFYALLNAISDALDFASLLFDNFGVKKVVDIADYYGSVCWCFAVVIEFYYTLRSAPSKSTSDPLRPYRLAIFILSLAKNFSDMFSSISSVSERVARYEAVVDSSYVVSGICGLASKCVELSM